VADPATHHASGKQTSSNKAGSNKAGSKKAGTDTARSVPRQRFRIDDNRLVLSGLSITFQRTLRVAEEGLNALPPGFGAFPLRVVDPLRGRVPDAMLNRGGVLMPMYQCEAMWISIDSDEPVAIQIGTGGRCVVSGKELKDRLVRRPQNYLVAPEQPWIDGYKTEDGEVRQFVAVAAGSGLSAEHQLTGSDSVGGIQIQVWHLRPEVLRRWKEAQRARGNVMYSAPAPTESIVCYSAAAPISMAIGLGGKIRQEIYPDTFTADDWQKQPSARVWVHLVNALQWPMLTGEPVPSTPVSTDAYIRAGLPWFDYYNEGAGDVPATKKLGSLKSIGELTDGEMSGPGAWVHPDAPAVVRLRGRRKTIIEPGQWDWA